MRKLLTLIAALIICDAYGEGVYWFTDENTYTFDTCEYHGNITTPAIPQKTGFRFMGWQEDRSKKKVYKILETSTTSFTPTNNTYTTEDDWFNWTITFPWGTVRGEALCGNSSHGFSVCDAAADPTGVECAKGTYSNPSTGINNGSHIWCRLTDAGGLVDDFPNQWLYLTYGGNCMPGNSNKPAYVCANRIRAYKGLRRALFGVAGEGE